MECIKFYRKAFFKNWILAFFLLGIFTANFHVKAQPGDALDFDNSNDEWVEIKQSGDLEGMNNLTASIWAQPNRLAEDFILFGGNFLYEVVLEGDGDKCTNGNLWWAIDNGTGDWTVNCTNININEDEWVHIALVSDNSANEIRIYKNGSLVFTENGTAQVNSNGNPIGMGKRGDGLWGFDGQLDEFRIWSEARSQQQIQNLMHKQIDASSYSNLEGYWRLNSGSGSTASDETSNSNDGTLKNNPSWVSSGAIMTSNSQLQYGGNFDNDLRAIHSSNTSRSSGGKTVSEGSNSLVSGDYILFGNEGSSGQDVNPDQSNYSSGANYTGDTSIEAVANREWLIEEKAGGKNVDFTFQTENSGMGPIEGSNVDKNHYVLIERKSSGDDLFVKTADQINQTLNRITFNDINISSTYTLGTTDKDNSPLPVELLYFKITPKEKTALLQWATASETNNKHFIVQKKTGQDAEWENIGRVMGHGTTTENHQYRFKDKELTKGTHYYRLKQVDFGGTFEHHPVEVLEMNEVDPFEMKVRPHHRQDLIELDMNSKKGGNYETTVINMKGHVVYQKSQNLSSGNQVLEIPMREVSPGIYIIRMQGQGTTAQKKFLIE